MAMCPECAPAGESSLTRKHQTGTSVEGESRGGDEHLNPRDDATDHGDGTADGLAGREDRPYSGRGERLPGPLPLVLAVGTATQQPVRVLPAPFAGPGLSSAPHRSLEQEVPESGQRQGQDRSQRKVVEREPDDRDGKGEVAPVTSEKPGKEPYTAERNSA
jgi:hypothetical protein